MTADDLRVGLAGYGLAGSAFHAPLISATPGLRLDAVVTTDAERRDRLAADHPGVRPVDSLEALLEAPGGKPGLVVVANANRAHVATARAALEAGVPVVVDKPLAATSREAEQLCALASERGLLLTVFQNRRWDADFLTARALIEEGELGAVHRFSSHFDRWRPQLKAGWRESADPADAGGILYDLGSHLVDQAVQLFGPVTRVYSEIDARRPGAAVDDDAFLALTHASGVRSHLGMSALTAQLPPRLQVLGDRAAYTKYGLDPQEAALREGALPGGPGWGEEPEPAWGLLGTDADAKPVRTLPGDYPAFYRGVAGALRDGGPAPVDPRDAVEVLRVLEAARRSAQTGSTVEMES